MNTEQKICPYCGKAFTENDDIVVCPDCGTKNTGKFCSGCGKKKG